MREVTLQEMLDAREARAYLQTQMLSRFRRPLLSFTMNIPGPVKDSPLIRRGFEYGLLRLERAFAEAGMPVLSRIEKREVTGPELLCAVDAPAGDVKALCLRLEDECPMGRLFDMDVIDTDGRKLARAEERRCLVCGAPGRSCASRRLHSLDELSRAVTGLLQSGLLDADAERLGELVTQALLDEVDTTPKPGLVDRNNNGAHRDMTPETFRRSAEALKSYWTACFRIGAETAALPPEACFARLRALGTEAEKRMLAATDGVNTHKGAVFLLGAVCGAVGRLWQPDHPCRDPKRIAAECAVLYEKTAEADFAALDAKGTAQTTGERLYLQSGRRGVRGELAAGLPSVTETALPILEAGRSRGMSRGDAGVIALLHLIARGEDTNLIKRGGPALAEETCRRLRETLEAEPFPPEGFAEELDRRFIRQNLSPGGCADLLAVSYFLLAWEQETIAISHEEI